MMDEFAREIGKVKEQIEMEHKARRNYSKKWTPLNSTELLQINRNMYNQDVINQQLKEDLKLKDLCPYTNYTGEGDAYFVSRDMYNSLVAKCRCRRQRSEGHILKCVQKAEKKYAKNDDEAIEHEATNVLPTTSNGFFGWQKDTGSPKYQKWEQSMKYYSPILTMTGHRITATPYNAIIIG